MLIHRLSNKCLFLISILCFFLPITLWAGENTSKLIDYLTQEKSKLNLAISSTKPIIDPSDLSEFTRLRNENAALLALMAGKIASLEEYLSNQLNYQALLNTRLKQLQQFRTGDDSINVQEKITQVNALTQINNKAIELIREDLTLAKSYQAMLTEQQKELSLWAAQYELQKKVSNLKQKREELNAYLQNLFSKNVALQQAGRTSAPFKDNYSAESKILLNNQLINLTQQKINDLNLEETLNRADFKLLKTPDLRTLQKVTEVYQSSITQYSYMELSLKRMAVLIKRELLHIQGPVSQQFKSVLEIVNTRLVDLSIRKQTLEQALENHQKELKKQLSTRQSLSEYSVQNLPTLLKQIVKIPSQFYTYIKSLYLKIENNHIWFNNWQIAWIWLILISSAIGLFFLRRIPRRLLFASDHGSLSGHLYKGIVTLIYRNWWSLSAVILLFELFYFNKVPFTSYLLLAHLILIWLIFRILIGIARLSLLERQPLERPKDKHLYKRLRYLLLLGGWFTALLILGMELPLTLMLQDLLNRFFMLFLMFSSLVIWSSRAAISQLLLPVNAKKYIQNAILMLILLTPSLLFLNALIGLIGYINLAWTLSRYLVKILLIISAYVLLRGVIFDILETISREMLKRSRSGWLWIEVLLKPADKILRLLLICFCIFLLFQVFAWDSQSLVVQKLIYLLRYPLVAVSGIHITLGSIIRFTIVLAFFIWLAKWTREFCYRWVFRKTNDPGIRNSLSVFTQYAVILIGAFITFRVLGLDLSGMSMILGGFAVGMGFGLRDFASNIVGGLTLLIERPVREGDIITIGNHEGKVSHIGIRSIRVSSSDNMEVLIPNAEAFNKPFTNWTHQDNIIRTLIKLKASRDDDPALIQRLILDTLAILPEVLHEPRSEVFLKEIDDAWYEFEVHYFINLEHTARNASRSKFLFAIDAQFKAAGIKPPIPAYKFELPGGDKHSSNTTE